MSAQQREDMWKWITRSLVALIVFFLAQVYFSFKEVQAQTNATNVKIESLSKDIEYIKQEVFNQSNQ